VIVVVALQASALVALAKTDVRPLLGAGIVLLTAALGVRPRHLIAAASVLRMRK